MDLYEYARQLSLSRYVYSYAVTPEVTGLYVSFGHEVTFLPNPVWQAVKERRCTDVPANMLNDLVQRKFLVEPGCDEALPRKYAAPPLPGFASLWLIGVNTCNMACGYCVVEAEGQADNDAASSGAPVKRSEIRQPDKMSWEVAEAAIRIFFRGLNSIRPPQARVTFYGGEPMLNRDLLYQSIPLIRSLSYTGQQYPVMLLCFTNGLIYDPKVVDLFARHHVTVGLSLDGMQHNHDAVRKQAGGQGTFERIIRNYHRFKEAGLDVGISCTIGKHNINDLTEIARYFAEELRIQSMQFQAPIQTPDHANPYYVDMAEAARPSLEAFRMLREAGIPEGLAMRRISRFTESSFHYRDCLAVGGELAVAPDGTIGPCHNATRGGEQYFWGNVLDPNCNPDMQANFIEWHSRMPLNMPACQNCALIGLCGGGCPYNALLNKGSIWETDPQLCGYLEQFVNWLLEDVWQRYCQLVHIKEAQ